MSMTSRSSSSKRAPRSERPSVALVAAAVAVGLALFAHPARADVVGPPPDSCPLGSTPATGHSGPRCSPSADCTSDTACGTSSRCVDVMQCIETRACGGLMPPDSAPCTVEHVVGACDGAGACAVGVCRARRVCSPDAVGRGSGCSCRLGPARDPGTSVWLAALALGFALVLRRRA